MALHLHVGLLHALLELHFCAYAEVGCVTRKNFSCDVVFQRPTGRVEDGGLVAMAGEMFRIAKQGYEIRADLMFVELLAFAFRRWALGFSLSAFGCRVSAFD